MNQPIIFLAIAFRETGDIAEVKSQYVGLSHTSELEKLLIF
jgi:hypothetical protein